MSISFVILYYSFVSITTWGNWVKGTVDFSVLFLQLHVMYNYLNKSFQLETKGYTEFTESKQEVV